MSHEELFLWEKGKEKEGNRRRDGTCSGWGRELHKGKYWVEDWILNGEIKWINRPKQQCDCDGHRRDVSCGGIQSWSKF